MRNAIVRTLYFLLMGLFVVGCASQAQLSGGDKDEIPPSPKVYSVADSSVFFSQKSVTIEFDENIQLRSASREIYMSPPCSEKPEFSASGKKLSIKLNVDSLQENTTYTIHFRKAVVDLNEGNPLENFTYTFSTGDHIDSLKMRGTVRNAFDRSPKAGALVCLFKDRSSDIKDLVQKRPNHVSFTNEQGLFEFTGLPEDEFRVISYGDENGDFNWQIIEEIGYITESIYSVSTDSLNVLVSKPKTERVAVDYTTESSGKVIFTLSQEVASVEFQSFTNENKYWFSKGVNGDSLTIYTLDPLIDMEGVLVINGIQKDTFGISFPKPKSTDQTVSMSVRGGRRYNKDTIQLVADRPVVRVNEGEIVVRKDSVVVPTKIEIGGELQNELTLLGFFEEGIFTVDIDSGAVVGSGDVVTGSKTSLDIAPIKYESLSMVIADSQFTSEKPVIIDLLTENGKFLQRKKMRVKMGDVVAFQRIRAGKYQIRVIMDDNANGIWDPINVAESKQPERIMIFGVYEVLEGWEAELIRLDFSQPN